VVAPALTRIFDKHLKRHPDDVLTWRRSRPSSASSRQGRASYRPLTNKWEEQHFLGEDEEAEIEYGVGQTADALNLGLRELCREFGEREAA
jgi:hypothetical protein